MKILVTGGAGYIGSTVASALLDEGHTPVILDSLVTGLEEFTEGRVFYRGDIADGALLDRIFGEHPDITAAVHCAALIVVPDSVAEPLRYYRENVAKTIALLEHLERNGCRRVLFSSSASVYQPDADFTVDEDSPVAAGSPYAQTKAVIDRILADTAAGTDLRAVSLRYFNPIGADPRMRTGLQIREPSHALGKMIAAWEGGDVFRVTGVDWPTADGSGIRDYIHVWDLARAHVAALTRFDDIVGGDRPPYLVVNLGTGKGTTVRELAAAFGEVTGTPLRTEDAPSRPGDVAGAYTRTGRSARLLGWKPEYDVRDGIRDSLTWRGRLLELLGPVED
ncbi:UDP-glucose 4-epimerase GalE [Streptomyces sp. NPDC020983]|uniref:UDP-glucose 4-epimerase GalE n=1 Tax=Streptomyces sp. NPDC020983 TaxID=3365106 RepID=UPI0037965DE6